MNTVRLRFIVQPRLQGRRTNPVADPAAKILDERSSLPERLSYVERQAEEAVRRSPVY